MRSKAPRLSCEKRHRLGSGFAGGSRPSGMHDRACVGAIASVSHVCRFQASAATVRVRVIALPCEFDAHEPREGRQQSRQHAVKSARCTVCSSTAGCRSRAENWGRTTGHRNDSKWHLADGVLAVLIHTLAARRTSSLAAGPLALADHTLRKLYGLPCASSS